MSIFFSIILLSSLLLFGYKRGLRYLSYFQQEGYESSRFIEWVIRKKAYDKRATAALLAGGIISYLGTSGLYHALGTLFSAIVLLIIGLYLEQDPRNSGKVRLVLTQRAKKIFCLALALYAICTVSLLLLCPYGHSASIITVQVLPLILVAANALLSPFERVLQERYKQEAIEKLHRVDPLVIGITGSYGKTSTKAILGDLLNQGVTSTFWPRGSINTVMGITRDIRENLRSTHRVAIIEMGAYGVGSIRTLCNFTPPRAAIVTAVGVMHLERFGSEEAVYNAKSELPQALPQDGILVCNADNPGARRMARQYGTKNTYLYGLQIDDDCTPDCYATDIVLTGKYSRCTIVWKGVSYPVITPLLGRPALSNALGAFTMACLLGADPQFAAACLSTITPVTNRLSSEYVGGVLYLQDAFNSNPQGFTAALEVLQQSEGIRKILITPGMIELANRQFEDNRRVAEYAGGIVDLAIVVGDTNKKALVEGLLSGGLSSENIRCVSTRGEGFEILKRESKAGDVILIENDLPDVYEGDAKF